LKSSSSSSPSSEATANTARVRVRGLRAVSMYARACEDYRSDA
jgi:hypothetical protein